MRFLVFVTLATTGLLVLSQCASSPRDEQQHNKWNQAYKAREAAIKKCHYVAENFPQVHTKEDTWICLGRAENEYKDTLNQ